MPTALGTVASGYKAAPAGGPSPFPLAAWYAAYWAADPLWSHPANGAVVTAWRDGSGNGRDMTSTVGSPLYRSAYAGLNNQPAIEFTATGGAAMTANFPTPLAIPFSMVAVIYAPSVTGEYYWLGGTTASTWGISAGIKDGVGWMKTNDAQGLGAVGVGRHYLEANWNGAESGMYVDGVNCGTGRTLTGEALKCLWTGTGLFDQHAQSGAYTYAFVGLKSGVLTATESADMLAWAQATYATPSPPVPLSGLKGWWDAADPTSVIISTGDSVQRLVDKSRNNYSALWVNGSWPATRIPAAMNGKTAIDYHPGSFSTTLPSNIKPLTIMMACKTGPTTGNVSVIGYSYGAVSTGILSWDHNNGVMRLMRANVAQIGAASSAYTASSPAVLGLTYAANDVWTHYRNGAAVGTGTTAGTFAASTLAIGGAGVPNIQNYDGQIGEFLIYDRVLSTVERQQVESYLKTKWGTP